MTEQLAELKKTQTQFLFPCQCGLQFKVPIGKAGHVVQCPHCQTDQQICGLRELKRYRSIEKSPHEVSQLRFGIKSVLLVTLLFAVVFGAFQRIRIEIAMVLVGLPILFVLLVILVASAIHNYGRVAGWFWGIVQRK